MLFVFQKKPVPWFEVFIEGKSIIGTAGEFINAPSIRVSSYTSFSINFIFAIAISLKAYTCIPSNFNVLFPAVVTFILFV